MLNVVIIRTEIADFDVVLTLKSCGKPTLKLCRASTTPLAVHSIHRHNTTMPPELQDLSQEIGTLPQIEHSYVLFVAWCIVFLGLAYFKRLFARTTARSQM